MHSMGNGSGVAAFYHGKMVCMHSFCFEQPDCCHAIVSKACWHGLSFIAHLAKEDFSLEQSRYVSARHRGPAVR